MKILILFLFSFLCVIGSEPMDPMTVDEMTETFGDAAHAENVYGYADIPLLPTRGPRSSIRLLSFNVRFADKSVIHLNMRETDRLLFDTKTPVWKVANNNGNIEYTRDDQMLRALGAYTIYQDLANKAALIVFDDSKIVEGYVKHYRFEEARLSMDDYNAIHAKGQKRYMLFDDKKDEAEKAMLNRGLDVPVGEVRALRPGKMPSVVYPQILVVMNEQEALRDAQLYLRKMLAYWNSVDMFYSAVTSPRIKINIAAIVIPTSENTAPWLTDTLSDYKPGEKKIDGHAALVKLNDHFFEHKNIFPRDTYDFIFSFTEHYIVSDEKQAVGLAPLAPGCFTKTRGALIRTEKFADHEVTAHELGHLLSAGHDEDICSNKGIMGKYTTTDDEQRQWTSCTLTAFRQFFALEASGCLDNCPTTEKYCDSSIDNDKLPNYLCPKRPADLCALANSNTSEAQDFNCNDEKLFCLPKPTNNQILAGIGIDLQNGIVCTDNPDDPEKPSGVCYEGECVPYTNDHGFCEYTTKN